MDDCDETWHQKTKFAIVHRISNHFIRLFATNLLSRKGKRKSKQPIVLK